jgi:hypothetical protein
LRVSSRQYSEASASLRRVADRFDEDGNEIQSPSEARSIIESFRKRVKVFAGNVSFHFTTKPDDDEDEYEDGNGVSSPEDTDPVDITPFGSHHDGINDDHLTGSNDKQQYDGEDIVVHDDDNSASIDESQDRTHAADRSGGGDKSVGFKEDEISTTSVPQTQA